MSTQRIQNKLLRDPIHGVISYDPTNPLGRLLLRLVDSPEMQRLRHIRQLGLALFVYPAAEHSRFSHSLGVAHIAQLICERIHRREAKPDEGLMIATCAAALLHDIGHAPFSHAFEPVLQQLWDPGTRHEQFSERLILWEEGQVYAALAEYDPTLPQAVADFVAGRSDRYTAPIISSQLDADRMDYLLRDGYMTGVQNYHYDAERIQEMLSHDAMGLIVDRRALPAVESYLLSRLHMYQQVYFHKTLRAAEGVLRSIFKRAVDLLIEGGAGAVGICPAGPLGRVLEAAKRRAGFDLADYARLSDHHVWVAMDGWRDHSDPILSGLCSQLLRRKLLKSVEIPEGELYAFLQYTQQEIEDLVRAAGLDPVYHTLLDRAENVPFQPYEATGAEADAIRIDLGNGRLEPIEHVSPLVRSLSEIRYRVFRYYFPEQVRSAAYEIVRRNHPEVALIYGGDQA